jgi:hypothetical protein
VLQSTPEHSFRFGSVRLPADTEEEIDASHQALNVPVYPMNDLVGRGPLLRGHIPGKYER